MHNLLIHLSNIATALSLGIYTALGAIFHGEYETNPTWSKIRNAAFLAWLLLQFLLHYIGRMGEITIADYLALILTLAAAGYYTYAVTCQKKEPSLGMIVWLSLAFSLCGQTYYASTQDYLQISARLYALTLMLSSAGLTIAIHQIKAHAKRKAWLAQFDSSSAEVN